MAASGDVTIAQDGGQRNVKLHPYVVALVRWCVSCLWSAATVLLHRLAVGSSSGALSSVAGLAGLGRRKRRAGTSHLHPEPLVECEVLHSPPGPQHLDVIFVHGLYGSLENTWRQGEWRSKYKIGPNRVPLRRPSCIPTPCNCETDRQTNNKPCDGSFDYKNFFTNIDERFLKNLSDISDQDVFTEKFYKNTMIHQIKIVDNYDAQADFVKDLFKYENENEKKYESDNCIHETEQTYNFSYNNKEDCGYRLNNKEHCDQTEDYNENNYNCNSKNRSCDCTICNSQNSNCNLNNYRAHIDCKTNNKENIDCNLNNKSICDCKADNKECEVGCGCVCDDCYSPCWPKDWIKEDYPHARVISINYTSDPHLWRPLWIKENKRLQLHERAEQMIQQLLDLGVGQKPIIWVGHSKGGLFIKQIYCEAYEAYLKLNTECKHTNAKERDDNIEIVISNVDTNIDKSLDNCMDQVKETEDGKVRALDEDDQLIEEYESETSSGIEDDIRDSTKSKANLWSRSAGFMFYSVPHRGSPLADFKTPITVRSIELLEIAKDCSLVLSLQERWLSAAGQARPVVRSLVETCRTLMSVLWLRIVSTDSADPGIGALCGVSVDHREICKPSSRHCLLYTELMNLMRTALSKCRCQ